MNNELICTPVAFKKPKFTVVCHDLWQDDNGKYSFYSTDEGDQMPASPIELYLVSEEEIKGEDWVLILYPKQPEYKGPATGPIKWDKSVKSEVGTFYKIEATTDKSLGLPLIPSSFIEEWVAKQGKIDKVRIEMCQQILYEVSTWHPQIHYPEYPIENGEVIILPIEDKTCSREEVYNILDRYRVQVAYENTNLPSLKKWFDKHY